MQITPLHFELSTSCSGQKIEYKELHEISQGGPLVGNLTINSILIGGRSKLEFGGPLVCFNEYVILPYFYRFSFRLCAINVITMEVKISKVVEKLILLKDVNSEAVEYFVDLDNTCTKSYPIKKLLEVEKSRFSEQKPFWSFFSILKKINR